MQFRERLWTYSLVTGVAVLIWFWAAAETRDKDDFSFIVRLAAAAPTEHFVSPGEVTAQVDLEGSRLALEKAGRLKMPLVLTVGNELPSALGMHDTDLATALAENKLVRDTGVRVLSADPPSIDIEIDALVTVTVPIRFVPPPQLAIEGDFKVDPLEAELRMPSRLRDRVGGELEVEAHVLQHRIEGLEPGPHTVTATLRPPDKLRGHQFVTITPPIATIKLAVHSRIEEVTLPVVRVQIAGPPKDHDEYAIEIDEKDISLTDVTIKADGDLIKEIEQGKATVVALVHLSNAEKERRIESKPVTCFLALRDDGSPTIVEAEAGGSAQPIVHLRITERTKQ